MEVFVSISQQVSSRGVGMGVRFSADVNLPVSLVSFFFSCLNDLYLSQQTVTV